MDRIERLKLLSAQRKYCRHAGVSVAFFGSGVCRGCGADLIQQHGDEAKRRRIQQCRKCLKKC